jgi:hypothetical protein
MRSGFLPGLLFLLAASSPSHGGSGAFAHHLPAAVGDISEWEIITGDFETAAARGSYLFYVNPRRQGMYQLMRYRVELLDAGSAREHGSAERVAFVRRPGLREPLLCWRHEPPGTVPAWRQLQAGSDEYKLEMATLMQVLAVHRAIRSGGAAQYTNRNGASQTAPP